MKNIFKTTLIFIMLIHSQIKCAVAQQLYLESWALNYISIDDLPKFRTSINSLSHDLNVNPNALMSVIALESSWDPSAYHNKSKAAGLIQLTPIALENMKCKITADSIIKMSIFDQLPLIKQYFDNQFKTRKLVKKDIVTLYLLILCPRAINSKILYIKNSKDSVAYHNNVGLDIDKNDSITVEDITLFIYRKFPEGFEEMKDENNSTNIQPSSININKLRMIDSLIKEKTPNRFDKVGFICYIFRDNIKKNQSITTLFNSNKPIQKSEIQPLDLVFFKNENNVICHVGIMINENSFAHVSINGLKYSELKTNYYNSFMRVAGFCRILND